MIYILEHALHLKTATIKSSSESDKLQYFLDRNMPLHRAPVIESFRLKLTSSRFKPENINLWVAIAVSHCLRELEILYESDPDKPIILLSSLFTCKSLAVLKLDGDILLDVPRMVSLPSLKTLKLLQSVRYLYDESLQRLLSNCPILEDLVVKLRGYGDTMQKLTVVVPSLQSLSLFIPYSHEIAEYVIETPSLKYFKLVDYSDNDHYGLIENMPYLIEAYVDCCCPDIYSLINSITYVKRLTICSVVNHFPFIISFYAILDGLVTLVFNQLEHLEVCLCTVLFSNQLVQLLNASSKLKRLDISLMDVSSFMITLIFFMGMYVTVPECLLSSLQSLNWLEYTGEPQERDIVVYILKHARHLKTATITSFESDVPKFEMIKELALSPRASTTCQLLPDELLVKILMSVPTKVAVSTSILSKRWEYLWMWLPKLEYLHRDHCSEPGCKRLQSFLDRNLPLHRAPVIETFRLESCSSHFKPENISMWVSTAVSHCLRELDILHDDTEPAKSNILPSNLFTCKSLVILKLVGEILLDVPRVVSLPSLKTLKLQSSLSLYIPYCQDIDGFVIETPNLKYFKLMDHSISDHYCLIEKMPCLIEAYLEVKLPDMKSIIGSITSVKRLAICSEAIMMLGEGFVFNQLEHLEVCFCTLFSSDRVIELLLKASSNLKRLDFSFMDVSLFVKFFFFLLG
uniref:FBD domain-containing protein n=1 Tax=Brassica oleracea TaxID=3712 RepID=A0A3P6GEZ3_BRAOL|nr:unnamed protein product [Brassica oleracea]